MIEPRLTTVSRHVDATLDQVYDVLADGWLLALWVVGATHIRDVDAAWPAAGSQVHHQVGAWPVTLKDSTRVDEDDWPRRFALTARGWPFGEARVVMSGSPDGAGSTVTMGEAPTRGVGRALDNPLARRALAARNHEALRRLADVVEHRIAGR